MTPTSAPESVPKGHLARAQCPLRPHLYPTGTLANPGSASQPSCFSAGSPGPQCLLHALTSPRPFPGSWIPRSRRKGALIGYAGAVQHRNHAQAEERKGRAKAMREGSGTTAAITTCTITTTSILVPDTLVD